MMGDQTKGRQAQNTWNINSPSLTLHAEAPQPPSIKWVEVEASPIDVRPPN